MPLISYAQNGEDVVLDRALKDVEFGHYIDVGAHDPEIDSVTKIFYDRGWSGVNVEASRPCFERVAAGRQRDRNLHAAIAAQGGTIPFHEVSDTGMSTLDPGAAEDARLRGHPVETVAVPTVTLAELCRDLPFSTTHFLKIDVEGGELGALQGADFSTFHPWIVVVEATRPNSTERTDGAWRSLLEDAGYEAVLFDGLNLFFLAPEHGDLRERLSAPANVLDHFVSASLHRARVRAEEMYAGTIALSQKYEHAVAWAQQERVLLIERYEAALAHVNNEMAALARRNEEETAGRKRDFAATMEGLRADIAELHAEIASQKSQHAAEIDDNWHHAANLTRGFDAARTDAVVRQAQTERGRAEAEAIVGVLRNSLSWRATRPLRVAVGLLRGRISLSDLRFLLAARVRARSDRTSSWHHRIDRNRPSASSAECKDAR